MKTIKASDLFGEDAPLIKFALELFNGKIVAVRDTKTTKETK